MTIKVWRVECGSEHATTVAHDECEAREVTQRDAYSEDHVDAMTATEVTDLDRLRFDDDDTDDQETRAELMRLIAAGEPGVAATSSY